MRNFSAKILTAKVWREFGIYYAGWLGHDAGVVFAARRCR
jgi:hypothetical protein